MKYADPIKNTLYSRWIGMRVRCNNPNHKSYKWYGGKGIKVCKEWDVFMNFYNWALNNGFSPELTIDRIDSNKNYEPSNCRWIPMEKQQRNKSNNIYITFNNETKIIGDWAKEFDINENTLRGRYSNGADIDRLFLDKGNFAKSNPNGYSTRAKNNAKKIMITYNGKTQSETDWAEEIGISQELLWWRLNVAKMDLDKALLSKEDFKKYSQKGKHNAKNITFNGETHNITEWAEIYGLKRKVLSDRLNKLKSPFEKAILPTEEYREYRKSLKNKGGILDE